MGVTPVNTAITNTTAATRTVLSANTSIRPTSIYLEALGTNTGYIYFGLATVSSTVYISRLSAGQGIWLSADGLGSRAGVGSIGLQLSALYIDSSVSGEKAQLTYMYPTGG